MKKSIYVIAIALMFSLTSYAQQTNDKQNTQTKQAPTPEKIAKNHAERMKQQYLLGDDQYEKVYKLCLKKAEKQVALRNEMQKEQEQMNAEMKKILNETQYERYEQHQNRSRQMMRRGMQRGQFHGCPYNCPAQMRQGNMMTPKSNMMQMPQQQLKKGPQIDKQTQQQLTRRRMAMYDDTKKLNNNAQNEQQEQK